MQRPSEVLDLGGQFLPRRWIRYFARGMAVCVFAWMLWPHAPLTAPIRTLGCAALDERAKAVTSAVSDLAKRMLSSPTAIGGTHIDYPQEPTSLPRPSSGLPGC